MRNSMYHLCLLILVTIITVTDFSGCGSSQTGEENRPVFISGAAGFEKVPLKITFIKGWDSINFPVSYTLVRSPEDFTAIASTVDGGSPPSGITYSNDEMLIVSRTTPAPLTEWSEAFDVDSVSENGDTLSVFFHFQPAEQHASWLAAMTFCLKFPRKPYTKIVMIENGTQVGELHPAEGQWSVPARP
jgi:hypothetical protein